MKAMPTYGEMVERVSNLEAEIARQKKVAEALREGQSIHEAMLDQSLAGIYVVQDGIFRSVNPIALSYTGFRLEELIGRKSDSLIHPEDRDAVRRYASGMLRKQYAYPYECRIVTKQRETRWILGTVAPILFEGRPAILGNAMDITERVITEEMLRESENLYRAIFATTGTATMIVEDDMTISLINSEFENLTGFRKEQWEGKRKWTEFAVDEDAEKMRKYHDLRRSEPECAPRNYEFRLIDNDGRLKHVFVTVDIIPGTKKSVASMMDITERKLAEGKLKESENLYRTIFETTGTAAIIIDGDMIIEQANTEFEKLTGYSRIEWEGKRKWTEHIAEQDLPRMKKYHRLRRTDPSAAPRNYEYSLIDGQGRSREIFITVDMIPGTKKSVAAFTDITAWKQTEKDLIKREQELEMKSRNLQELNTALRVLLKQREEDRGELEEKVLSNVKQFVLPYMERIKKGQMDAKSMAYVHILESNLSDIISPFSRKLSSKYMNLTPKEIQVANLIRDGKTSKEIADILNVSRSTVDIHRYRIRNKLGLKSQKFNLRSHLSAL